MTKDKFLYEKNILLKKGDTFCLLELGFYAFEFVLT